MSKRIYRRKNAFPRLPFARGTKRNEPNSRSLVLEPLEQRRLLSVDLDILRFNTESPEFDLNVAYRIIGESSPAFDIGIY